MLVEILSQMLANRDKNIRKLRGGLLLIMAKTLPTYRDLYAVRQNVPPSERELVILRRDLEQALLPYTLWSVDAETKTEFRNGYHAAILTMSHPPVSQEESNG